MLSGSWRQARRRGRRRPAPHAVEGAAAREERGYREVETLCLPPQLGEVEADVGFSGSSGPPAAWWPSPTTLKPAAEIPWKALSTGSARYGSVNAPGQNESLRAWTSSHLQRPITGVVDLSVTVV